MGDEGCSSPEKQTAGAVFGDGATDDAFAQREVNPMVRDIPVSAGEGLQRRAAQITHRLKQVRPHRYPQVPTGTHRHRYRPSLGSGAM